jgi:hypothetical protein
LQNGKIMDGVSRVRASDVAVSKQKNISKPNHATLKTQKSQTLYRKAVHKPTNKKQPSAPVVHQTNANVNSRVEQSATGRGMLLKRVPDVRLTRAMQAQKSSLINKFNRPSAPKPKITTSLVVAPAPSHNPIVSGQAISI